MAIFILEIVEFNSLKKLPIEEELLPTFKRLKEKQVLVKSGVDEEMDFSKLADNSLMPLNVLENLDIPKRLQKNQIARAMRIKSNKK